MRSLPLVVAGIVLVVVLIEASDAFAAESPSHDVGFAKVDITPGYNMRLSGFAARQQESVGVREPIFARAMAIRSQVGGEPVVLVTVESIGVPMFVRDEVASRLHGKRQIANERFALCSTHSHTTPALDKVLPTLFGAPVPAEEQQRIARYTRELTDKIEQAALAALDDMRPARLAYGIGSVGFSINRRTRGGPVDHDLPVMAVTDENGKIRGVWTNYACHCVVLSDLKVSGDWAGYGAKELERIFPDCVACISIGCGADSNPQSGVTGDKGEVAEKYGHEVAAEVERVVHSSMTPIADDVVCQLAKIELPLAAIPTREEWVERAKQPSYPGYYARVELARLDAGEKLPTEIPFVVQSWKFGKTLACVFLSGEVVVDYSLRLKKECDAPRLWVNAYSNDVPCYVPSERVLKEGGYEGGGAMVYYGWPAAFAPGLEDKIVGAVGSQLGEQFRR